MLSWLTVSNHVSFIDKLTHDKDSATNTALLLDARFSARPRNFARNNPQSVYVHPRSYCRLLRCLAALPSLSHGRFSNTCPQFPTMIKTLKESHKSHGSQGHDAPVWEPKYICYLSLRFNTKIIRCSVKMPNNCENQVNFLAPLYVNCLITYTLGKPKSTLTRDLSAGGDDDECALYSRTFVHFRLQIQFYLKP